MTTIMTTPPQIDSGDRAPALGRKVTEFEGFDTFERPGNVARIEFNTDELRAVCPVTEQNDAYSLTIIYRPLERCVETKTLKLYLATFEGIPIFAEALAAKIAEDIHAAVNAMSTQVVLHQWMRGGIVTDVTAFLGGGRPE